MDWEKVEEMCTSDSKVREWLWLKFLNMFEVQEDMVRKWNVWIDDFGSKVITWSGTRSRLNGRIGVMKSIPLAVRRLTNVRGHGTSRLLTLKSPWWCQDLEYRGKMNQVASPLMNEGRDWEPDVWQQTGVGIWWHDLSKARIFNKVEK